jgi:hypothetical protein
VITGALILAIGILIGIALRSLPARRKDPEPVEAVCGCTHHHSMHDPRTGACNAGVRVARYSANGAQTGYGHRPCACVRYSGPEPIPLLYAPEIATGAGQ